MSFLIISYVYTLLRISVRICLMWRYVHSLFVHLIFRCIYYVHVHPYVYIYIYIYYVHVHLCVTVRCVMHLCIIFFLTSTFGRYTPFQILPSISIRSGGQLHVKNHHAFASTVFVCIFEYAFCFRHVNVFVVCIRCCSP